MSCECSDDTTKRKYYSYYDTPDGCDVDKKVMVAARYGVIAGLVLGTYDVLMFSHAVGLGPTLRRYGRHMLPLGMMGATFAVVANGAQRYREKDDGLNYFLGGMACGPLAAWYLRSKHAILLGGLALGVIAYIKKDAVDHCVTFFPDIPDHFNFVNGWRNDWTMASDPKILQQHTCGRENKK